MEPVNEGAGAARLKMRLRGTRASQAAWVDLALALPRAAQASRQVAIATVGAQVLVRLETQAHQLAVDPDALFVTAARLALARYAAGQDGAQLAVQRAAQVPLVVPLEAPGRPIAAEILADTEGWLRARRPMPDAAPTVMLRLSEASPAAQATQLDLSFSRLDGTIIASSPALFGASMLDDLVAQVAELLRQLAGAAPQDRVDDWPLPQGLLDRLSRWGTRGDRVGAEISLVHRAIERTASERPQQVAVSFEGRTLTYGELNRRANRVAHGLVALGVQVDDRVGLCVERGLELVVGLLAALKAGAAYVPLDPAYPAQRLRHMLDDSQPRALLATQGLLDRVASAGVPVLVLDAPREGVPAEHDADPHVPGLAADHLAYVIYTSGSTGQPKGAGVEHRGLANLLRWYIGEFSLTAQDRFLVATSFSFDLTQKNILAPLCLGGQVHLASPRFDPQSVLRTVAQQRITALNLTPSFFHALCDLEQPGQLASLRHAFLGGEPVAPARFAHAWARHPQLVVVNSYGPTECSDVVAACRVPRPAPGDAEPPAPPIGGPVDNTVLYVLDAANRPVAPGLAGEIHVGGVGVGRGYLNQPELTRERFVDDPLRPGQRMYKTGDLGRWRDDGALEFLGRRDFQVKIRGFRIELGEIEAQLARCPGVLEAVVVARATGGGDQQLVGYVVPQAGAEAQPERLRAHLLATLPDHMVPTTFVSLASFPLTPSGKLDRLALPAPEAAPPIADEAPATPTEAALRQMWQELLGRSEFSLTDNFFEIGGHSLLATRLVAAVSKRLHADLSVLAVFEHRSVRALARVIDGLPRVVRDVPAPLPAANATLHERDELTL